MFWRKNRDKKSASDKADARSSDNAFDPMAALPADDLLWLEEVEGADALDWVKAQNARSQNVLEADPRFVGLNVDACGIVESRDKIASPSLIRREVRNFWQDDEHVRGLWRRAPLDSYLKDAPAWETILDIDALAEAEDENWVFAGVTAHMPARDRVMLSLSRGGADAAVRREFDIPSKSFVEHGFNFPEAKGSVAWADGETLYAALALGENMATASGYPRTVRRVVRDGALDDAPAVFEGQESDIGVWPAAVWSGGKAHIFITRAVTFFDAEHYMLGADDTIQRLPLPSKSEVEGVIDGLVIASLQEDWSASGADFLKGDLVAVDPRDDAMQLIFRPGRLQAVSGVAATESMLLVEILDDIAGRVLIFRRDGERWTQEKLVTPGEGQVSLATVNADGEDFFITYETPTTPSTLYYVDTKGVGSKVKQSPAFFDATDIIVERCNATAPDGEQIPYFVMGRRDVISAGNAPVIQYGYGGFEVPTTPGYSGLIGKLWLERGGVFAIANIRGGGEYGPRWHQAALKEKRQVGFNDFFAVSEHMIETGLTSPERLGAYGGSNGGLLMGVALTQRPDLYKGLAIGVPLLDMMRYHLLLAGASWVEEYGDPEAPEERAALAAYSPYHHLSKDKAYPVPFFFTSTRDDRVHPGHARKMAARMEAMGHDFLYFENIEGGHGAAANLKQAAYRAALQYIYFSQSLGLK